MKTTLGLGVLGLLLTGALARAEREPAAVITQFRGQGTVHSVTGRKAAATGVVLYPNDRLRLERQSSATLAYPNRPPLEMEGGQIGVTVPIGLPPRKPEATLLARVWQRIITSLLPGRGATVSAASRYVSLQASPLPTALRPADSRERQAPLVFTWQGTPGARYTLVLLDGQGQELWHSDTVTATRLAYPSAAPSLIPGQRYWWEVRQTLGSRETASVAVWFELLTAAQTAQVAADLAALSQELGPADDTVTRQIQQAALLVSAGLYSEAGEIARTLRQLRPQDAGLEKLLGGLLTPPPPAQPAP